MAYELNNKLFIGISSRALFDLEQANATAGPDGARGAHGAKDTP